MARAKDENIPWYVRLPASVKAALIVLAKQERRNPQDYLRLVLSDHVDAAHKAGKI